MRIRHEFADFIHRHGDAGEFKTLQRKSFNFAPPLDGAQAQDLRQTVAEVGRLDLLDRKALADLAAWPADQQLSPAGQRAVDRQQDEMEAGWRQASERLSPEGVENATALLEETTRAAGARGLLFGQVLDFEDGLLAVQVHRQTSLESRAQGSLSGLAGSGLPLSECQGGLMQDAPCGTLMVDTVDGVAYLARP